MNDQNSRDFSYSSQLAILLGLTGAGFLIGTLASVLIWKGMTGRPILTMMEDIINPKYYSTFMTIQGVSTFLMFFLPVFFTALICYRNPFKFIGLKTRFDYKQLLIVLGILLLTFPLSAVLAELTKIIPIPHDWTVKFKKMETDREAQEAVLININSFSRYLLSMVIIGLLPAIFEEVCFRGGLQNILTRWFKGPWIAIILTAILFSAIHTSYYGFLVRFALGMILGLIFYYSGSLWLSVIFHFLYNGLQVTALYAATLSGTKASKDIEDNFPIWTGAVALIIIIYAFVEFRRLCVARQKQYVFEEPDDPDDFSKWITKNS